MARSSRRAIFNSLAGGIHSEATPLNFPEGTSLEEVNFQLSRQGERKRRLGLDLEPAASLFGQNLIQGGQDYAHAYFEWDDVGNQAGLNLAVIQWGASLVFFTRDASDELLGSNQFQGTLVDQIDLRAFTNPLNVSDDATKTPVDMAAGAGDLFVTSDVIQPFRITWTGTDFEVTPVNIVIRDFKTFDDDLGISERPAGLSTIHDYNLKNRGWTTARITAFQAASTGNLYPSNADIYSAGLKVDPTTNAQIFDVNQMEALDFGSTSAPLGHFQYDAMSPEYSFTRETTITIVNMVRADGSDDITITTNVAHGLIPTDRVFIEKARVLVDTGTLSNRGPGKIAGVYEVTAVPGGTTFTIQQPVTQDGFAGNFVYQGGAIVTTNLVKRPGVTGQMKPPIANTVFAGRLCYSNLSTDTTPGLESESRSNLYFSQLLFNRDEHNLYLQAGDPTSQFNSALVPTDGGTISVPEIGSVSRLVILGNYMFVFASNGVWGITGSDDDSFNADSILADRVSAVGVSSPKSVVLTEDNILYWSNRGIYSVSFRTLEGDRQVGKPFVESLIEQTIQTFYNNLTKTAKFYATGIYDPINKWVSWYYYSQDDSDAISRKDRALFFNTVGARWTQYVLNECDQFFPIGIGQAKDSVNDIRRVKVIVRSQSGLDQFSFAEYNNTDFIDWENRAGGDVDAAGFIETAYLTLENPSLNKDIVALSTFMERTEQSWVLNGEGGIVPDDESSCLVRAKFEWSLENWNGTWSAQQQVYKIPGIVVPTVPGPFESGASVIAHSLPIRGEGRAIVIRFDTEPLKNCILLGWTALMGVEDTEEGEG